MEKEQKFNVVCAWCGMDMLPPIPNPDHPSHGICDSCKIKHFHDYFKGDQETKDQDRSS